MTGARGPMLSRLLVAAMCACIVVALAGCTGTDSAAPPPPASVTPSASDTFLDGNGVVKEYQATVVAFPLSPPSGVTFPAAPPKTLTSGEAEPGVGEGVAYAFWLCAWEGKYLSESNAHDFKASKAAAAQMSKWTTTTYYRQHIGGATDGTDGWVSAVLQPAQNGQIAPVEEDFNNSGCANFGLHD